MAELSTFSATSAVQESVQAPPETIAQVQETTPNVLDTSVSAASEVIVPEIVAPEVENNNSNFELSLGDEANEPTTPQAKPQINWDEELKKAPREVLLKALNIDPFAVEIDQHIKGGGQPLDYLQARAIDYNKFSDEAIIKDSMRKENPTLSPSQIDRLYNHKYKLAEEAEDEDKEFVAALQQSDAYKIRQTKIAEQQKFKISETPIPQTDEAYELWKQNRDSHSQAVDEMKSYYSNHPSTKALNESKRVTINLGEGVTPFNFVVDKPEVINRVLTDDGRTWDKLVSTPQGEPDVAKQQLLTLVAVNPNKFCLDLFNYGVQMGEKKRVAEGQNAMRPQGKIAQMEANQTATYRTSTYGKQS